MTQVTDAEEKLKWRDRAIELMLAIDRIRDTAADERELTSAILTTLADAVEAELCLLCLRDDDTGELQLRAVIDRMAVYDASTEEYLRNLAARAADLQGADFLNADLTLKDRRHTFCLAAPLRVSGEGLGALLLLNADRPFNGDEQNLVNYAISQIDSAMQHARTVRDLQRRQLELETIFRIDHIRDEDMDFQAMLDMVLAEVCRTIAAETGFLMLYDRVGNELELRATTDRNLFSADDPARLIRAVADEAIRAAELINRTYPSGVIRAIVGVPLILENRLIGVLGVVNRKGRGAFTRTDLEMLRAIASQMDTAIFESLETQKLRAAFGKCVGPQVMDRLLSIGDRDPLSGERIVVTTLFSDIRGFTNMSEKLDPELLQGVLNDHLSALTDLVLAYEGTLDKYIGDCVMAIFNAPERQPDHALRAVRLALDMHKAHHQVMARWRDRVPLPPIGIGLSTGDTMMGNFGSVRRLEYTAIGADVNLASRLCGAAAGDQTLISESTYHLVKDIVAADPMPPMHLKGIEEDVRCWNVRGLK
ncbi:MAG: Guanylate cyclase protein [Anaerolineales bacterium]|nr:Guanylate cyclase protein [Anaerolineales bacterium]